MKLEQTFMKMHAVLIPFRRISWGVLTESLQSANRLKARDWRSVHFLQRRHGRGGDVLPGHVGFFFFGTGTITIQWNDSTSLSIPSSLQRRP